MPKQFKPLSSTEMLHLRELLMQRERSFNGDNADITNEASLEGSADQEEEAATATPG
jgi:hypothetical protein